LKKTNLKKSHLLPAAVYKRLRNEEEENPNPVLISSKTAVQTSRQLWANLLCEDCEQRLNKYGEKWVLENCIQKDGSFPIASILASRTPNVSAPNNPTKIYYACSIPEINVSALSYFAASIFWRGSIYAWRDDDSKPVTLGSLQEEMRKYLLGLIDFPKNCSLRVLVREGKETDHMTYLLPSEGQKNDIHICKYAIPGLAFMLLISDKIDINETQFCIMHGKGNPIFVTTIIEKLLVDEVKKLLKNQSYSKRE